MLLSPKEVGQSLGVATRTAQRLMADGQIRSLRVGSGKLWRCRPADVEEYISRRIVIQMDRYQRPIANLRPAA
jgi:excisionase family DNA binding protein